MYMEGNSGMLELLNKAFLVPQVAKCQLRTLILYWKLMHVAVSVVTKICTHMCNPCAFALRVNE